MSTTCQQHFGKHADSSCEVVDMMLSTCCPWWWWCRWRWENALREERKGLAFLSLNLGFCIHPKQYFLRPSFWGGEQAFFVPHIWERKAHAQNAICARVSVGTKKRERERETERVSLLCCSRSEGKSRVYSFLTGRRRRQNKFVSSDSIGILAVGKTSLSDHLSIGSSVC